MLKPPAYFDELIQKASASEDNEDVRAEDIAVGVEALKRLKMASKHTTLYLQRQELFKMTGEYLLQNSYKLTDLQINLFLFTVKYHLLKAEKQR